MPRLAYLFTLSLLLVACGDDPAGDGPDAAPGIDADAPPEAEARGEVLVQEGKYLASDGPGQAWLQIRLVDGRLPSFHAEVARAGACRLLRLEPGQCGDACPGVCVAPGECRTYPAATSAGRLRLTGLARTITIDPDPQGGYYDPGDHPADLFADDAVVTLTASGAALPAFSATAGGVKPIVADVDDGKITLTPEQDHTFRWTPADPGSRVRLTLNANNQGHGLPYLGIIECDAPDEAGQIVVPAALVDGFPPTEAWTVCAGTDCPPSSVMRYRQGTASVPGGHVRLRVASVALFGVEHTP